MKKSYTKKKGRLDKKDFDTLKKLSEAGLTAKEVALLSGWSPVVAYVK